MLTRLSDFSTDRRFPWNRTIQPKLPQSKTKSSRLFVALTFDVEQDGGSSGSGKTEKIRPFFSKVRESLGKRSATFFIQGSLVEKLNLPLKRLSKKHEFGVHAWSHDRLWGGPVWFLSEEPLNRMGKESHLQQALASFKQAGFPQPKAFRATNLVVDEETLSILGRFGFRVDSSWESFRDFRQPFRVNGLWEIPVSSLPLPRKRFGLVKDYQVMNMANLRRLPTKIWQENVQKIVRHQNVPHLVFMGHSWDFGKKEVEQLLTFLEKSWQVEYLTMQELAKNYE